MKQRQIKYRVWNPELKRMDELHKTSYLGSHGLIYDLVGCNNTDNVWLEFTGLNDEDGNEIYEKDIVLYKGRYLTVDFGSYIEAWDGVCPKDGHNAIGWYLVDEEEKCIKSLLVSWGLPNMKGIIVKGNIYENSDLLLPQTT